MALLVSIILPCRNEKASIAECVKQAKKTLLANHIDGEIIVSDSSTDGSELIAKKEGAIVIKHNKVGYGNAILEGAKAAKGRYLIIADSDGTYDLTEARKLIDKASKGFDLVIGNRLSGKISDRAMPWHHRYIGNPCLSAILNLFFSTHVSDTHSGFRLISRKAFNAMDLRTTGMEFASEMIIKASKNGLRIAQVPISYSRRKGESKLKSFSDGWRHLRFMLMFSPTLLFIIPGIILSSMGMLSIIFMLMRPVFLLWGLIGASLLLISFQILSLGLYSRIYAIHSGFEKNDPLIDQIAKKISLEKGISIGSVIILAGLIGLSYGIKMNLPYISLIFGTLLLLGVQAFFSVFFISIMLVEKRD